MAGLPSRDIPVARSCTPMLCAAADRAREDRPLKVSTELTGVESEHHIRRAYHKFHGASVPGYQICGTEALQTNEVLTAME